MVICPVPTKFADFFEFDVIESDFFLQLFLGILKV